jgi:glycosyltransferase involved in cell wall biosynthesis
MKISIAICTWNRAKLLDQTLTRMQQLRILPEMDWELLVVNNNCTDDTDAVIARHADKLPLRRLHEPKQGHSNARNCAVAAAQGDLLIWTDDDVLVDPNWLEEYVRAAKQWPEAVFFGGTVEPWFAVTPPPWMLRHMASLQGPFAVRELGKEVRPLADGELPFGANMAFRTKVLKDHEFDPRLGHNGDVPRGGEETQLMLRLKQKGQTGIWVGTACVKHYIPAERLTTRYIRHYFRSGGQAEVRRGAYREPSPLLLRAPRWAWRQYWQAKVLELLCCFRKDQTWFDALRRSAILRGVIDEWQAAPPAFPS